ncbi:hypothetical protein [Actinoallomurus rhizosphaericola]|uniref:hypothetical protein n=1 Tax=Actinoallomurus rhizosphaericola TaxID=2952536 RepID=UPI0020931AEB|nr:hypothetical protein [Actinoallomurus rhizosphaericola]
MIQHTRLVPFDQPLPDTEHDHFLTDIERGEWSERVNDTAPLVAPTTNEGA